MTEAKPKKTPSQKGRHARRKGADFERRVARLLRPYFPKAKRGVGQTRNPGEVPDVEGTPFWIEAKCRDRVDVDKALSQAELAAASHYQHVGPPLRRAVVIWKITNFKAIRVSCRLYVLLDDIIEAKHNLVEGEPSRLWTVVTMKFEDWIKLVTKGKSP